MSKKRKPSEEVRRDQLVTACKAQRELRKEIEDRWEAEKGAAEDSKALYAALLAEYNRRQGALDAQIVGLVQGLGKVRPGTYEVRLIVVSTATYSEHGQGAEMYARTKAEMIAAEAAEHGVKTEVRQEEGSFTAVAFVKDISDAWLIGMKPRWQLREMVRQCWLRGVNPRVYNPAVPQGFETAQGIDFSGRDLREDANE